MPKKSTNPVNAPDSWGLSWFFWGPSVFEPNAKDGTAPAITLFSAFIVQLVFFVITQREKGPLTCREGVAYWLVGGSFLILQFTLWHLTRDSNTYCYDQGTKFMARLIFCICLALFFGGFLAGVFGQWPDQEVKPTTIPIDAKVNNTIPPGLAAVQVDFNVGVDSNLSVKPQATFNVQLDFSTAEKWRSELKPSIQQYTSTGTLMPTLAMAKLNQGASDRGPIMVTVSGMQAGLIYRAAVFLQPKGSDYDTDARNYSDLLKSNNPTDQVAAAKVREKWLKNANDFIATINLKPDVLTVSPLRK